MRWAAVAVLALGPRPVLAVEQEVRLVEVEVTVTAVSGGSVYLDAGRDAGLEVGDLVRFVPLQGAPLEARLDAVAGRSAHFQAGARARELSPGERGVVRIPDDRPVLGDAPDATSTPPRREVPEHPPWEAGPVEWDASTPLLAPAGSTTPDERASRVRGRVYDRFQASWDGVGPDRSYLTNRLGVDLTYENPFERADGLRFRAEAFQRSTRISGEENETESEIVVDRASYYRGGQRTLPNRFEVGRFLPLEFPEFGVLDGAEYSRRLDSGGVVGGNVGMLPRPDDTLTNDDDFQAAVFYRSGGRETRSFTWAGGYQKTWHEGNADRDLVVLKGDWLATPGLSFLGAAWIDIYGPEDEIKKNPLELTELQLSGSYSSPSGHGAGFFYTHRRWPELLRREFQPLPPEQILNNRYDRVSFNGWLSATDEVRVGGRVDHWQDQDTSGVNGELRVDLQDLLYDRGNVALTLFRIGGAYRTGLGARATATRSLPRGFLSLSLESTRFDAESSLVRDDVLLQHAARASYDWPVAGLDVSAFAEQFFGDEQDTFLLGFLVQKRF